MEVQASFLITPQLNLNNPALYATTPSLFKRIAVVAFLFSFVHNYLRMKYSIPKCTKMKCVLVCRQFSFNLLDQPLVGTLPCAFHQGFPFFHVNASAVRFVIHKPFNFIVLLSSFLRRSYLVRREFDFTCREKAEGKE